MLNARTLGSGTYLRYGSKPCALRLQVPLDRRLEDKARIRRLLFPGMGHDARHDARADSFSVSLGLRAYYWVCSRRPLIMDFEKDRIGSGGDLTKGSYRKQAHARARCGCGYGLVCDAVGRWSILTACRDCSLA